MIRQTIKVVIECGGKILLVKPTYGHKSWSLPGGGKSAWERPEEAAIRETREEVGIELSTPVFCGSFAMPAVNNVSVFKTSVEDAEFEIDGVEIAEARWFSPDEIPVDRSPRLVQCLELAGYL